MEIKGFYLKTYIHRYKYICIVVHIIPKLFMGKYKLYRIAKNKWLYGLLQTGNNMHYYIKKSLKNVIVTLPRSH